MKMNHTDTLEVKIMVNKKELFAKWDKLFEEKTCNMSPIQKLDYANECNFYNQMIDVWSEEDYAYDSFISNKIKSLERSISK